MIVVFSDLYASEITFLSLLHLLLFFFNDTAPTEISPLPLHAALPICVRRTRPQRVIALVQVHVHAARPLPAEPQCVEPVPFARGHRRVPFLEPQRQRPRANGT